MHLIKQAVIAKDILAVFNKHKVSYYDGIGILEVVKFNLLIHAKDD